MQNAEIHLSKKIQTF